ncbi:MAG TPA: HAD family hydrolase [Dehalococcoidia bacterium]|nr:HAD family hydrolase [Dehalococcoidia bacterium]
MTALARTQREPDGGARRYKMAVLDVDGTLLDSTGGVSPRVRNAVLSAHDSGCLVTLASGRRLWAIRPVVRALGISVPVVLYNGAVVYDVAREETILNFHLKEAPLHAALDLIWQRGFQPVVYGHPRSGELVYTGPSERDSAATTHYFNRPTTQPRRLNLFGLREIQAPPLLAAMGEEAGMRGLEGAVLQAGLECATLVERQSFVPGSRWWQLDLSAQGCSKGAALRGLCSLYGIDPRETLAVGDGINDLDLIRSAGCGIAMGNAVPEVAGAAAAIVADNGHDGAAEAVERFILGQRTPILIPPSAT